MNAIPKWAKSVGVTHRGKDCETRAVMDEKGQVWIPCGKKWLRCWPLVGGYFSPDKNGSKTGSGV